MRCVHPASPTHSIVTIRIVVRTLRAARAERIVTNVHKSFSSMPRNRPAISHRMWNATKRARPPVWPPSIWTNPAWSMFSVTTARPALRNASPEPFSIVRPKCVSHVSVPAVHLAASAPIHVSNIRGPARKSALGKWSLIFVPHTHQTPNKLH